VHDPCPGPYYNSTMRQTLFALLIVLSVSWPVTQPARPSTFDVLIRNGRVMDGSGNPWRRADIGITSTRITAIGRLSTAQAKTIIDVRDRLITPGFIDVHSHAAEGLRRETLRQGRPLLAQGVTTIVANPDGGGPVDLAAQRSELQNGGIGLNVVQLIGHGSVRNAVMERANRRATPEELERMRELVRRGMEQGAFGLSSGLFYTPGSFADTEELIALAAVAGEFGGVYTSHIRDEGNYSVGVVAAVEEVIRIAEQAHTVGIVSHMKALGPDNWGLSVPSIAKIDDARSRGVQVFADQYPYEASSTSLRAALLPGGIQLPSSDAIARENESLSDEEKRSRETLETTIRENLGRRGGASAIQIAAYRPDPSLEGKTLADIAHSRNMTPEGAALELMARGSVSIVSFNMSEEDIRHIMTRPYTMASSDGGLVLPSEGQPHPRDYGAFARRLAVYVRERGVVSLEFAVRSMTSLPASVFGLNDRGWIREGAIADLAIFDPTLVRDRATYTNPHQLAEGMAYVLVNGKVVIDDGKFNDTLAGEVIQRR
jgi:N-acyl-D-amino-acid deacylase